MNSEGEAARTNAGTRAGRLAQNVVALLRTRLEQAQHEGRAAVREFITGVMLVVVAIVLLALAVPLIAVTLVLLLATVVPAWAATAVVLGAMILVAVVLWFMARRRFHRPRWQFLRDLRDDVTAIRKSLSEGP